MSYEELIFDKIKEKRDWGLVEYDPPRFPSIPFAGLHIVFSDKVSSTYAVSVMEQELKIWLDRYPVPLMVTSFDGPQDRVLNLSPVRSYDHLIGWLDPDTYKIVSHWRVVATDEYPKTNFDRAYLLLVYRDVSFQTSADLKNASREKNVKIVTVSYG